MSIVRYRFTSCSIQSRHDNILEFWPMRSLRIRTIITVSYYLSILFYILCGLLVFRDTETLIKNRDGLISYYRQNIINLYFFFSTETFNAHFNTFYVVEALYVFASGTFFIIFEILLVTLCLGLCCQMQIINSAFESVGHTPLRDPNFSVDGKYPVFFFSACVYIRLV